MIEDIREIMTGTGAVVHGDLSARLDPDVGLILTQLADDSVGPAVIILDAAQLAHLHRLTAAMVGFGREVSTPEGAQAMREEFEGWSGL